MENISREQMEENIKWWCGATEYQDFLNCAYDAEAKALYKIIVGRGLRRAKAKAEEAEKEVKRMELLYQTI